MTMKRILQCVLVLIVLATAGCSYFGESESAANKNDSGRDTKSSGPQPPPKVTIDLDGIIARVNNLNETISENPALSSKHAADELKEALTPLGTDEADLKQKCTNCTSEISSNFQKARAALVAAQTLLKSEKGPEIKAKDKLQSRLSEASLALTTVQSLVAAASATPTPPSTPSVKASPSVPNTKSDYSVWDWLILTLAVLLGLLVLAALVMGALHLRKQSKRNFENQLAKVAGVQVSASKEGQKELAERLTSLAATQKEISNGLLDLHTEVRSLARLVRESLSDRNDRRPASSPSNHQTQMEDSIKEEPEFPVSADDYLGKMDRFANVVRPDFQNGILVNDPEGKGELMLIRDARLADEAQPLFVVPRATQFQTKQDFYTHYAKYYDCVRPTAGSVWILGPAVVEKVNGGWRLREKGMLEIR
jgi:hypothetical protein